MTALQVAEWVRTPDPFDPHTPEQRAQWERAGRDLDDARRQVRLAVGLLYPWLRVELVDVFVARWVSDTLDELERLDSEGELPRGAR